MNLVSSNSIKLTDLVTKYYPNYDTNKKTNTTIANLLLHNAGLPYDYPGKLPATLDQIMEFIVFAKPIAPVGTEFHKPWLFAAQPDHRQCLQKIL